MIRPWARTGAVVSGRAGRAGRGASRRVAALGQQPGELLAQRPDELGSRSSGSRSSSGRSAPEDGRERLAARRRPRPAAQHEERLGRPAETPFRLRHQAGRRQPGARFDKHRGGPAVRGRCKPRPELFQLATAADKGGARDGIAHPAL